MLYDAIIVGASVSGSRTAELVAKNNYHVLLLEEHKEIGKPSKCTGLVSWRLKEILPKLPKEIFVNKIKKANFLSPSGNCFTLKSKHPADVIRREKLDEYLFKKAVDSGVVARTREKFENFRYMNDSIKIKTNKKIYKTRMLIGADGCNSQVRKQTRIACPNTLLTGIQTTTHGTFDSDTVELWFGSKICPEFFAWVVPEGETRARVGLATKTNCKYYFDIFLKKRIGEIVKPNVGGLIRIGLMDKTVADRIILVGDAACQIKPFSGGGVVYGLIASKYCADACVSALKENRFEKSFLRNQYDKKWREKLEKPIRRGLLYRNILNKLSDMQLNIVFSLTNNFKLTRILEMLDMDLL